MKAWGLVVAVLLAIVGSAAHAQSLGDAAKKEQERREKNKKDGTAAGTKVIHEEDLHAPSGKDAKGTFNPDAGTPGGAAAPGQGSTMALPPVAPSPGGRGIDNTEVDVKRAAARRRLEASYARIAGVASSFVRAVRAYDAAECAGVVHPKCAALLETIGELAMTVGAGMDEAEDAARQGWLNPGEVRAIRERYRLDDSFWDELARLSRRYRR